MEDLQNSSAEKYPKASQVILKLILGLETANINARIRIILGLAY